jgi:nucleotide-binding universal stress UspA family protein
MSLKLVLAPVVSAVEDESALAAANVLAVRHGARAVALIIAVHPGSAFAAKPAPLSHILEDLAAGSGGAAARERGLILERLERASTTFEVRDVTVEMALTQKEIVAHARCADLNIMTRAVAPSELRRLILENVVFGAGRPLMLMPAAWRAGPLGERVLIGWNASREAVRAVNDALPLLVGARHVVVATIDAKPGVSSHGESPGRDLAAYLARHGVAVEVRNVDGLGRPEGKVLIETAVDVGADMIVMGAYGHSRTQERLFGGVTRYLLESAEHPLLLSH